VESSDANIVESTDNVKDNVIQFQDVDCRISGKDILRGITLNVRRGEIMGFLGKNGAGKTTLLSLISGLRSHTSGKITVLGEKCLHIQLSFEGEWVLFFKTTRFTKS